MQVLFIFATKIKNYIHQQSNTYFFISKHILLTKSITFVILGQTKAGKKND